jgi:hypothetical protein
MKNALVLFALLISLVAVSCKKDNTAKTLPSDTYIFGHFFGFCAGEQCVEIFKLEDGHLYEDTNDTYPMMDSDEPYVANWVMLPQEKYDLVSDAQSLMPAGLLTETETILGIPDASDGGGTYIQTTVDGVDKFWLIDNMIEGYLDSFVTAVRADIELLNQ